MDRHVGRNSLVNPDLSVSCCHRDMIFLFFNLYTRRWKCTGQKFVLLCSHADAAAPISEDRTPLPSSTSFSLKLQTFSYPPSQPTHTHRRAFFGVGWSASCFRFKRCTSASTVAIAFSHSLFWLSTARMIAESSMFWRTHRVQ